MKIGTYQYGCCVKTTYSCDECNKQLFEDPSDYDMDNYGEWKFCPYCGEPIVYDDTKEKEK
jgi:DNA-directed RNA polymerase subunit RPC12/RpoP